MNSSTLPGSSFSPEDEGISAAPLAGFLQRSDPSFCLGLKRDFFPSTEKREVDVEQSASSNGELGKMSASSSADMRSRPLKDSVALLRVGMLLLLLLISILAEKSELDDEPSPREEKSKSSPDWVVGNNGAGWSEENKSWLDENAAA